MLPLFRAPGGKTSPRLLQAAGLRLEHVGWAPAGFLGDELPSDRYPNDRCWNRRCATSAPATSWWRTWASGRARTPGRRRCWSR
jgi:peptidoglycan-N-acetylmuramic acid deacetylase